MSKLRFYFHPEAIVDIETILEHYLEVSTELPQRFFSQLYQYINVVRMHPSIFREEYNCRRVTLPNFPYIVYYRIQSNYIEILGVFNGYMKPKTMKKSVKSRKNISDDFY